ncbi:hypothetical protein NO1_1778, partial [Candidatus Termititenax aidoneus]
NLGFFPKGTILAFSKDAWDAKDSAFKAIWKVCDGTNNTPNLVGRFLRGAEYPAGSTGGADSQSVTLETKHMPRHSHTFSGDTASDSIDLIGVYTGNHATYNGTIFKVEQISNTNNSHHNSGNDDRLKISFSMTPSGAISETGGSNISGKGDTFAVNTAPGYYAVIYIMKTS